MPDIANVAPFLQSRLEGYPFFAEMELDESEADRTFRLAREARARGVLKDDLTRQIDHILYTEWDPIGVHSLADFDCYDEYHRYLPVIVGMLREDAPLAPDATVWYFPISATCRNFDFILKLHH